MNILSVISRSILVVPVALVTGGLSSAKAIDKDIEVSIVEAFSDTPEITPITELTGSDDQKIEIDVARDEYEVVSFAVRSSVVGSTVHISYTQSDGSENPLPMDHVDLKSVKRWYQADQAWTGRYGKKKLRKLVPELLLNDDSLVKVDHTKKRNLLRVGRDESEYIDISTDGFETGVEIIPISEMYVEDAGSLEPVSIDKGRWKQFWVTVDSGGLDPGVYEGEVVIRVDESEWSMPLAVSVRDIRLCEPGIEYSLYYRGRLSSRGATISSEFKSEHQLRRELSNMLEHGVSNPVIYQSINDVAMLDRYLAIREEVGMDNESIFLYGIRTGYGKKSRGLAEIMADVDRISPTLEKHDVEQLYIYGIDEAKGDVLRSQKDVWSALRSRGIRIFVAGYDNTMLAVDGNLDVLVHAGKPKVREKKVAHRFGNRVFSYNNPQVGAENPEVNRRNYGLELWRSGYDGMMNYAYQTSFRSVWNDFDHLRFRDHNYTYPTVDGVIDTIAWEGLREGVDDVRYLTTLSTRLASPECSSSSCSEAMRYLERLRQDGASDLAEMRDVTLRHMENVGASCEASILTVEDFGASS